MIELAHQGNHDHDRKNRHGSSDAATVRVEFKDTLKTESLFNAFMEHLFSEYCAECLLAIVEFTQFKQKIVDENPEIEFENDALELYGSLIKSSIVYRKTDLSDTINFESVGDALYNKYIRVGSEWEINIDYGNRCRYRDLFENGIDTFDAQELYTLFDPCIDTMVSLIIPAFTRFKNGKKYQMIKRK